MLRIALDRFALTPVFFSLFYAWNSLFTTGKLDAAIKDVATKLAPTIVRSLYLWVPAQVSFCSPSVPHYGFSAPISLCIVRELQICATQPEGALWKPRRHALEYLLFEDQQLTEHVESEEKTLDELCDSDILYNEQILTRRLELGRLLLAA